MKKLLGLMLVAILFIGTGCLKDGENLEQYYGLGVIQSTTNGITILADNSKIIHGAASSTTGLEVGKRVYFLYTLIREGSSEEDFDFSVKWNAISPILTKDVIVLNDVNRDTIGNDQVILDKLWLGRNFLNFDFRFKRYSKTHYFSLVYDPLAQTQEGATILEFRHKGNNDMYGEYYFGFVSFDLSTIDFQGTPPHKIIVKHKNIEDAIISREILYTPPAQ